MENTKDIALCIVQKEEDSYRIATYAAEQATRNKKIPAGTYPKYYDSFLSRVGVFVKLVPLEPDDESVEIANLYVASSLGKLSYAMANSMRGHFVCKLTRS